jgi:periplasmic protein TonB
MPRAETSPLRARWLRAAVGAATMVAGGAGAMLLLVFFQSSFIRDDLKHADAVSFDTPPPERKKPPERPPPPPERPKPQPTRAPAPAALTSGLAGLSFGLPQFQGDLLGDGGDLLGASDAGAVMSEDVVDDPPRPTSRTACGFPARARARNVSGAVTLSVLVQADGSLSDVRVLESDPPGIFDDTALSCVRGWRFEPARYEGRPVAVRARQTLRFVLE